MLNIITNVSTSLELAAGQIIAGPTVSAAGEGIIKTDAAENTINDIMGLGMLAMVVAAVFAGFKKKIREVFIFVGILLLIGVLLVIKDPTYLEKIMKRILGLFGV
ncbi:MAG: hypothetical protein LBE25_09380 [Arthrobacter sp.]|jgi:hypothetical protein|nr:hypothetical protein [Arthrobacter sp.]